MDQRRQRFLDYYNRTWKDKGGRAAFMKATGMKKARVSQLFDESQPFGELAARRLAQSLGLPDNYFEVMEGGLTRRARELGRMFDAWPQEPDKDAWYAMATAFLESKAAQAGTGSKPGLSAEPTAPLRDSPRTLAE